MDVLKFCKLWNWTIILLLSRTVVLKREPLGSTRKEFLSPGRKFVPGGNRGGKAVDEKTLSFYYYFIQDIEACMARLVKMGISTVGTVSTSWFIIIISPLEQIIISPLEQIIKLVYHHGSWGRCCTANRLSHHPELWGRVIHRNVDGLDIGRQHGQRFDLLHQTHKRPYPFVQIWMSKGFLRGVGANSGLFQG